MAILRSDTTIGGRNVLNDIDGKLSLTGGTLSGGLTFTNSLNDSSPVIQTSSTSDTVVLVRNNNKMGIRFGNRTSSSVGYRINGVAAPTYEKDASNKGYVDGEWFGSCTESTATRTVTVAKDSGGSFALSEYMTIKVSFSNAITTGTTLNVNGTGAKSIYIINSSGGHQSPSTTYRVRQGIHTLLYEAGVWIVLDSSDYAYTITSTLPVSKGGTGLTSTTNSSYTTTYFRAGTFDSTAPTSLSNGTFCMVYE